MRGAAFALCAVLVVAAPVAASPISIAAFRDQMAAALSKRFTTTITPVGTTAFDAKMPDGSNLRVNVDNAYQQYLMAPAEIDAVIVKYIGVFAEANGADSATIDQLVVIVRPTNYLTENAAPGADLSKMLPPRPLAGDLSLFLAVDSPTAIRSAARDDLVRWRIDLPEAWKRAVPNIAVRIGALQMLRVNDESGASGYGGESGLAPSLLATATACSPENPDGIAGQIVLVVSRDVFLYGVPSDPESMLRFWRSAKEAIARKETLSFTPITCRQGAWVTVPLPN
jgi:hypothetical protein